MAIAARTDSAIRSQAWLRVCRHERQEPPAVVRLQRGTLDRQVSSGPDVRVARFCRILAVPPPQPAGRESFQECGGGGLGDGQARRDAVVRLDLDEG